MNTVSTQKQCINLSEQVYSVYLSAIGNMVLFGVIDWHIQRMHFGVGFEVLCKRFCHSNPSVTMPYLGIEDKEVRGILLNEI